MSRSVCVSVCLSVCLSVRPSVCLSVCLSVCECECKYVRAWKCDSEMYACVLSMVGKNRDIQ